MLTLPGASQGSGPLDRRLKTKYQLTAASNADDQLSRAIASATRVREVTSGVAEYEVKLGQPVNHADCRSREESELRP